MNDLIYGKDKTERIVNVEAENEKLILFIEEKDGTVRREERSAEYWILAKDKIDDYFKPLKGNLHYKWIKRYYSRRKFMTDRRIYKNREDDIFTIWNPKESNMIAQGITYYKGMSQEEVSVLSFDIESLGLNMDQKSDVVIISNTFRRNGKIEKKMFSYDNYQNTGEMIKDWCKWVYEKNPSVICGHNINGYDFPYLNHVAKKYGVELNLGRDGSPVEFENFESQFRKDQTQSYFYNKVRIYGREVVDTQFLAIKYDIATKKYSSYALKNIIKQEGLEKKDRQHYDAGKIRFNYKDPVEFAKIKDYARDDGDDALALFDLMSPSFFYLTQSVPKPFQLITESATGSQVNSIMLRAYLQQNHSIPIASERQEYKGATSWGKPGIYKNVFKIDVASLYPSIMMQYNVCDKNKDPEMLFPKMVETFTNQRLKHKELAKTSKYYDDLQSAEKILINSAYGFLGTRGLVFNSPKNAAFITEKGREILQTALDWAKSKGYIIPNCDTDSISFCKPDFSNYTEEERTQLLEEVNKLYPSKIIWEDDGYYKTVIVIKTKNYILYDGKKIKTKGSALKATTKEKALQEFIQDLVQAMLDQDVNLLEIYNKYALEIMNVQDINRWTTRKTITDKVIKGTRENEKKVLRALEGTEYEQGDRVYLYYTSNDELSLPDKFNGDYHKDRLLQKLYDTLKTFSEIIDLELYPNYKLKKNKELLTNLVNSGKIEGKVNNG